METMEPGAAAATTPGTAGGLATLPSSSSVAAADADFFNAAALLLYSDILAQHGLSALPELGDAAGPASDADDVGSASVAPPLPLPKLGPGDTALAAAARELGAAVGEMNALLNTLNLLRPAASAGHGVSSNATNPNALFEHVPVNKPTPPGEWYTRQAALARGHKALALREASGSLLAAAERARASLPGQSRFLADLAAMAADGWRIVTAAEAQAIADRAAAAATAGSAAAALPAAGPQGPRSQQASTPAAAASAPRLPRLPHVVCLPPTANAQAHGDGHSDHLLTTFGHRLLAPLQVRAGTAGGAPDGDAADGDAGTSDGGATAAVPAARRRRHVLVHPPLGHLPSALRVTVTLARQQTTAAAAVVAPPATASALVDVVATAAASPGAAARDPVPWSVAASVAARCAFDLLTAAAVAAAADAAGVPPVMRQHGDGGAAAAGGRLAPAALAAGQVAGGGVPGRLVLTGGGGSSAGAGTAADGPAAIAYHFPATYRGFDAAHALGLQPVRYAVAPGCVSVTVELPPRGGGGSGAAVASLAVALTHEHPPLALSGAAVPTAGTTVSQLDAAAQRLARLLAAAAVGAASGSASSGGGAAAVTAAAASPAASASPAAPATVAGWQGVLAAATELLAGLSDA